MGVRTNDTYHNFAGGQIGPKMFRRYDLPYFKNSAEKMQNFIPYLQGPARFREGTRFVRETEDIATLHPFIFSDEQAYALEFSHRRIRVFKDGALVVSDGAGPITDIVQLNHVDFIGDIRTQITKAGHGLSDWDEVMIDDVNGVNGVSNVGDFNGEDVFSIRYVDADTFYIHGKMSGGPFVASPDSRIYKIGGCLTPYRAYDDGAPNTEVPPTLSFWQKASVLYSVTDEIETPEFLELQWTQAYDTMFMVHRTAEPRKLVRSSHVAWACSTYTRTNDFIASAADYPQAITFHEQRLIYGGLRDKPNEIRASKAAAFTVHTAGSNATDAFSYVAAERRMNVIRTMLGNDQFLTLGCSDGSLKMVGPNDAALSPTTPPLVKAIDTFGVARVNPVLLEKNIIYAQKDLKKIRAIRWDIDANDYRPDDLTKLSDEILRGEVRQMAYQDGNPGVLWVVLWDGGLVGLTMETQESIMAWHVHKSVAGHKFKSVCVTPDSDGNDIVWFIVERTIAGETKYFIETMDLPKDYPRREDYYTGDKSVDQAAYESDLFEAQKYGYHLDCGLSYFGLEWHSTFETGDSSNTLTPGATTGDDVTFTASTANTFTAQDVGREIWQKGLKGRAVITSFVSGTSVKCRIKTAFTSTDPMEYGTYYLTATTVTGLEHLEGQEVSIVVDGSGHPKRTVTNGQITLDRVGSVVHVGFAYTGILKTTNLETGGVNGPAQTKLKNIDTLVVKFLDTLGAKYGTDIYNLQDILFREAKTPIGTTPLLFSGETPNLMVPDSTTREKHMYIVQDRPFPCTVQMVVPYVNTELD